MPGIGNRPCRVGPPAAGDGAVFDIVPRPDHPGTYDYTWVSGPNPGYGFSSASSDRSPAADHERAIRDFLAQIDPETGHIE